MYLLNTSCRIPGKPLQHFLLVSNCYIHWQKMNDRHALDAYVNIFIIVDQNSLNEKSSILKGKISSKTWLNCTIKETMFLHVPCIVKHEKPLVHSVPMSNRNVFVWLFFFLICLIGWLVFYLVEGERCLGIFHALSQWLSNHLFLYTRRDNLQHRYQCTISVFTSWTVHDGKTWSIGFDITFPAWSLCVLRTLV